jgi:hypothetical protein
MSRKEIAHLARNHRSEAELAAQLELARPRGVASAEGICKVQHLLAKHTLELSPALGNLVARLGYVEQSQFWMRERMGAELDKPARLHFADHLGRQRIFVRQFLGRDAIAPREVLAHFPALLRVRVGEALRQYEIGATLLGGRRGGQTLDFAATGQLDGVVPRDRLLQHEPPHRESALHRAGHDIDDHRNAKRLAYREGVLVGVAETVVES